MSRCRQLRFRRRSSELRGSHPPADVVPPSFSLSSDARGDAREQRQEGPAAAATTTAATGAAGFGAVSASHSGRRPGGEDRQGHGSDGHLRAAPQAKEVTLQWDSEVPDELAHWRS